MVDSLVFYWQSNYKQNIQLSIFSPLLLLLFLFFIALEELVVGWPAAASALNLWSQSY